MIRSHGWQRGVVGRIAMQLFGLLALLACVRAPLWAVGAGGPPTTTVISSQATATYVDAGTGRPFTLDSNTVFVVVQALESYTLTASQTVQRSPGATVYLPHRLTNTGNVASDFNVSLQNLGGDNGDLIGIGLYLDLNSNGALEVGEPQVSKIHLDPGQHADLLVVGTVPPTMTPGQVLLAELDASGTQGAPAAFNKDTINVLEGPIMSVVKSASLPSIKAGEQVEFTMQCTNTGASLAAGRNVTVDGSPQTLVVLRDTVPASTTFVSAHGSGTGTLLFHRAGDPVDAYLSTAPSPASAVDAAAWVAPTLNPGGALTLSLRVQAVTYAGSDIQNVAFVFFRHPTLGTDQVQSSNSVVVHVPTITPTISYYMNDSWSKLTSTSTIGKPLYVECVWTGGNKDPQVIDHIKITLTSRLTGDHETYDAVETGPNTGIFRIIPVVPTADGKAGGNPGDGILQTVQDDTIVAQEQSSGFAVSTDILIDPFGIVFDSRTNTPIPHAAVTLLDMTGAANGGKPGAPAVVFQSDGVTAAPSTVITGSDGMFRFPLTGASTYALAIGPPPTFTFPSVVPPQLLPAGHFIDPKASYGGTFIIAAGFGAVRVDIPLDGAPPSGLFVEKSAGTDQVEIGDFLSYTVKVANGSNAVFTGAVLVDDLPVGFSYVAGSTLVGGARAPDPAGGKGPRLQFALGTLLTGQTVTLSYRVKVGPGTSLGYQENRAQASGTYLLGGSASNVSSARVLVKPGVFTDKGIVFGKVYFDRNRNGRQDPDEPGVPGIRIYIEDGTSVTTDEEGKYSLYGLSARTHAMRVDRSSLPEGAAMHGIDNRNARSGLSRWLDMKRGDMQRADFAVVGDEGVAEQIAARRAAYRGRPDETARALESRMQADGRPVDPGDVRGRPAAGTLGNESAQAPYLGAPPRGSGLDERNSNLPRKPVLAEPNVDLRTLMPALDNNTAGFLDLKDGDVLPMAQARVRVKGLAETTLRLTVNGKVVSDKQVGTRARLDAKRLEVWEYVGVEFKPGDNTLVLDQVDPFGNVRETVTLHVKAPGEPARLVMTLPAKDPQADGKTPVPVVVEVVDAKGLPVTARIPVTLQAQMGNWDVVDLDPKEPGVQTFITGGRAEFRLVPGNDPGECRVRAASGLMEAERMLRLTTALRPMFITGVVEGVVDFRRVSTGDAVPRRIDSLLETELDRLAKTDAAKSRAGARIAVFGKGALNADTMLTFAYDSNKARNTRLFRDIEPLDFYPIYGDASVKGYEAQSTSPFYMRIDSKRNYLMHGDFTTAAPEQDFGLGTYSRSLTGGKGHLETDWLRVNTFATHTRQRQIVDELPANGTSGPYVLRFQGYVINSEKVEIVTRDRNQPAVVLQAQPLQRFTDYVVDRQFEGIVFRKPVASLDANLNPVSVRVVYEVDQAGSFFWTYGGDMRVRLARQLWVGGTLAHDENPQDRYRLWSSNLAYEISQHTRFVAEYARSNRESLGRGSASRFELIHDDGRLKARVFTGHADAAFDNPTSILSHGRSESGARAAYQLDARTQLRGEFIRTADTVSGGRRVGFEAAAVRDFGGGVKAELGVRHADESTAPALARSVGVTPIHFTTMHAKISAQVPNHPEAQVFAEYEQDLKDSKQRAFALGGEYMIGNRTRLYARHELISSLTGRYGLNNAQNQNATVVGIDTDYMKDGHIFSEYRIRDAISGREAEAAIGLRNGWSIAKGLRLNTSFERVIGGSVLGSQTSAITAGLEYTALKNFKGTARLEYRSGGGQQAMLRSLGFAWKVNDDLSVLGRDVAENVHAGAGGVGRARDRMLVGVAFRPVKWNDVAALLKFERRVGGDDPGAQPYRRVNILSANVNYQLNPHLIVSAMMAGKWLKEDVNGTSAESTAQMVGGRLLWDLAQKWDLALQAARLFTPAGRSDQQSVGIELGHMMTDDLWVSVGYNFTGFTDQDLKGENYMARGVFFRLRLKLGVDDFGVDTARPVVQRLQAPAPRAGGQP